jgi:hypothetical protein
MAERRSMSSALSPDKVAFLRGESEEPRAGTGEPSIEEKVRRLSPSPAGRGRVTVTVRLEPDIAEALSRASAERKIKRLEPYKQQDIIGDALKQWLLDAGFQLKNSS